MKIKILVCVIVFNMFFINSNASKFKFISLPKSTDVFSENADTNFYCDTKNHWCNYAATRLHSEGIFTGLKIGDNYYFEPESQITRGEFLLYIDAIMRLNKGSSQLPFADLGLIPTWQLATVSTMYNKGIIHGKDENGQLYFNHDEFINRIEAAMVLNNILGTGDEYKKTDYSDGYLIPKYASGPIKNVTDYGLMKGYDDKSFRPYVNVSRAMLSDILCNLNDYYKKNNVVLK